MKTKTPDKNKIRFDLIKAMLPHVPFDGWSWEAMEQGAIDIGFENKKKPTLRMDIYKDTFKNGSIEFIDVFSEMIDLEVKENYDLIGSKPERVPEKIKKIIIIRLNSCQKYKEAIRKSISITAIPSNAKISLNILYRTCNSIWRMAGDKSTDFSFYTRRMSLAAVYTSTLLFWLNDSSHNHIETESFLDRRLNDISKISTFKKPFYTLKNISNNFDVVKNASKVKSAFSYLIKINNNKNSSFS